MTGKKFPYLIVEKITEIPSHLRLSSSYSCFSAFPVKLGKLNWQKYRKFDIKKFQAYFHTLLLARKLRNKNVEKKRKNALEFLDIQWHINYWIELFPLLKIFWRFFLFMNSAWVKIPAGKNCTNITSGKSLTKTKQWKWEEPKQRQENFNQRREFK